MHPRVAAVLLRLAWLDARDGDAEPEPPDGELGQVEQRVRAGKGDAMVRADRLGPATLAEPLREGGDDRVFADRFEGFAEQQEARGVVRDGQRVAVAAVAQLELALAVGAAQIVRRGAGGQRGAGGAMACAADRLDQAVPVQHGAVLSAGTRTSPSRRRTSSSLLLRAPNAAGRA